MVVPVAHTADKTSVVGAIYLLPSASKKVFLLVVEKSCISLLIGGFKHDLCFPIWDGFGLPIFFGMA